MFITFFGGERGFWKGRAIAILLMFWSDVYHFLEGVQGLKNPNVQLSEWQIPTCIGLLSANVKKEHPEQREYRNYFKLSFVT